MSCFRGRLLWVGPARFRSSLPPGARLFAFGAGGIIQQIPLARLVCSFLTSEGVTMSSATADRITGRNLIAGRWRPVNGTAFESHSPSNRAEVLGKFPA